MALLAGAVVAGLAGCARADEPNFSPGELSSRVRGRGSSDADAGSPRELTEEEAAILLDPSTTDYVVERPPTPEEARQGFYAFARGGEAVALLVEVLDWVPNAEDATTLLRGSRLDGSGIAREDVTVTLGSGWECALSWRPEVGDVVIIYVDPFETGSVDFRMAVAVAGGGVRPLVAVDRASMTAMYPWGAERAADLLDPWSVR